MTSSCVFSTTDVKTAHPSIHRVWNGIGCTKMLCGGIDLKLSNAFMIFMVHGLSVDHVQYSYGNRVILFLLTLTLTQCWISFQKTAKRGVFARVLTTVALCYNHHVHSCLRNEVYDFEFDTVADGSHSYDVSWSSNHRQLNCLFKSLFSLTTNTTPKLRVTGPLWRKSGGLAMRKTMTTFSALLAICAGNSGEFPAQRQVTRNFDVFFDLRLNKRLSKLSQGWWFETPSQSLWRHCNRSGEVSQFPIKRCIYWNKSEVRRFNSIWKKNRI